MHCTGALAGDLGGTLREYSEAAAHLSAVGSSGDGQPAGDVEDEADSAFVHQG